MRAPFRAVASPAAAGLALLCTALLCAALGAGTQYVKSQRAIITVINTNDSGPGSLRQAIADAQNSDTIQFDPALNGQAITLTSAELFINKGITISGPGPSLPRVTRSSMAPTSRIFHLTPRPGTAAMR